MTSGHANFKSCERAQTIFSLNGCGIGCLLSRFSTGVTLWPWLLHQVDDNTNQATSHNTTHGLLDHRSSPCYSHRYYLGVSPGLGVDAEVILCACSSHAGRPPRILPFSRWQSTINQQAFISCYSYQCISLSLHTAQRAGKYSKNAFPFQYPCNA